MVYAPLVWIAQQKPSPKIGICRRGLLVSVSQVVVPKLPLLLSCAKLQGEQRGSFQTMTRISLMDSRASSGMYRELN